MKKIGYNAFEYSILIIFILDVSIIYFKHNYVNTFLKNCNTDITIDLYNKFNDQLLEMFKTMLIKVYNLNSFKI
jgi:hypothetical protein